MLFLVALPQASCAITATFRVVVEKSLLGSGMEDAKSGRE